MARKLRDRDRRIQKILEKLASGETISVAVAASGTHRNTVYFWKRTDAAFRSAWEEAEIQGRDVQRALANEDLHNKARDGVTQPVFQGGQQVGMRQQYFPSLVMYQHRWLQSLDRAAADPTIPRVRVTPDHFPVPPERLEEIRAAGGTIPMPPKREDGQ